MAVPAKGAAWYDYQKALDEEVETARGSRSSVNDRLNESLNADGTPKAGSSIAVNWKASGDTPVFVDTTSFTVSGDKEAVYILGRRLQLDLNGSTVYNTIVSSSHAAGTTTIVVETANLAAGLQGVDYGIVSPGATGSLPGHKADHIRGGVDEIDGDKLDIDFTPSAYTPDTSPAEVTNVDELSAHLKGIDNTLSRPGSLVRPKFVYTETQKYDGGSVIFVEGETVTGAGGAIGIVVAVDGDATSGYLFLNNRNAVAYVNDEVLTGSGTGAAVANGASTKDSIVLYPGSYNHEGTKSQTVSWASKIGFRFGSGGSNAGSVNLDASNWFYLYVDDSAVVAAGTGILTDSEFVANKTSGSFADAKVGIYNGNDRRIFDVYSNSGSDLDEFFHNGDVVLFADRVETQAGIDIDTTWTDIGALRIPSGVTLGLASFGGLVGGADSKIWKWRTNGQTGVEGHRIGVLPHDTQTGKYNALFIPVITDSSQIIEVKADTSDTAGITGYTDGWQLPIGM